jgi:hypothetical protein
LENVDIFYGHLEYLRTFGIFYEHLVHFVFIWYIFSGFGIMYQEKSGNPGPLPQVETFLLHLYQDPYSKTLSNLRSG